MQEALLSSYFVACLVHHLIFVGKSSPTSQLLNQRMTFLIGPEAQGAFFTATDDVMSQDEVYSFMKPIFGPNVVVSSGLLRSFN